MLAIDIEGHVHTDASIFGRVVVVANQRPRLSAGPLEMFREPRPKRREDWPDVLRIKCLGLAPHLRDAQRLGLLDDDVLLVHDIAPFDRSEVRLDAAKAGLLLADAL